MQEERVCQFYKLSIRKNGEIYPCCLARKKSLLGNLFDKNIKEIIETKNVDCSCTLFKDRPIQQGEKPNIQKLHIEFSNECQAHCVCCQQQKEKMDNEKEHLELVYDFIETYKPKHITVIGGEVLIQPYSLSWLEIVKEKHPEISFDIVTNLCIGENALKKTIKIFDSMTVSILGFNPSTYNKIMGLNFETTMKNINYILENTGIKLSPKFLAMPTNLYEIGEFFKWALSINSEKIYLHNIREFKQCCNLEDDYWVRTFKQIENQLKTILEENKELIISKNKHFISMHNILANQTNIDEKYLENLGLKGIVKVTS
ncbi:MAG: radical SAM protein [Candidatus Gastranaerophilales bacterium]|nr:radical SAM protein [Candidatus Gastranaerophilales bacterium]